MNTKSFFPSPPALPHGQQISRRLALRTKPDGASSVGLGCSLVISSWLVQTTSLRLLIIRPTVMNKLPCGWRFTRHTAYSSKPAFWGAGWPLPSPTPRKFPPERRKRLASFADDAFFFFWLFIFKPREVTELLRRWCMGGCWSGQMGKCNYRCLRASGRGERREEEGCHKGEFKKRRQRHSSWETIVGKN